MTPAVSFFSSVSASCVLVKRTALNPVFPLGIRLSIQAWYKVLPDRVYKRVMGMLLSLVAEKVCAPVLGATDLGEEQTHALHRIFKTLEDAVSFFFVPNKSSRSTFFCFCSVP